jgi:hypothetical protein
MPDEPPRNMCQHHRLACRRWYFADRAALRSAVPVTGSSRMTRCYCSCRMLIRPRLRRCGVSYHIDINKSRGHRDLGTVREEQ